MFSGKAGTYQSGTLCG